MALLKNILQKIVLLTILISIIISYSATPFSYAKLDIQEGDFYYSGTTKGTYTVKSGNIFSWLLECLGDIIDWILGMITMGFRMVFVGWTALIEKILTWALETTVGLSMSGEQVEGINSTDLTSITDSSNNLTVQAIVYNHVPAFDINFFDTEIDAKYGGTGRVSKCLRCYENPDEPDEKKRKHKTVDKCCGADGSSCCHPSGEECITCKAYKEYLESIKNSDPKKMPIITQLKNATATWYYVLRMLSMAAMLIVLIGIGIKMGLSTIASEKAVYKRMLVDWVVGTIMLFTIHYIMYFTIIINESLVEIVEKSANDLNKATLRQMSQSKGEVEVTDEELEVDMYEEIRTRAYDARLSVGASGMLMYMTLVYFAVRYSLVYIKRFFTLLVLTIMGPAVGVAYALQKVLSGKAASYKTWLQEYIMNVLIQTVHAIIYAVFISTALILSLESVPGMIVALMLMNYSLKAEETFRKIFKFGDGDSLVGHTAEAGNAEKIQQGLKTAAGIYTGAKPLAGALMHTPFANAVKGTGKLALAGSSVLAGGVRNAIRSNKSEEERAADKEQKRINSFGRAVDREMDAHYGGSARKSKENGDNYDETNESYEARRAKAVESVLLKKPKYRAPVEQVGETDTSIHSLLVAGEDKLKSDVERAISDVDKAKTGTPQEQEAAKAKYDKAMADYSKFKALAIPTNKQIARAHAERLVDVENNFHFEKGAGFGKNFGKFIDGAFGTTEVDYKTGKIKHQGNAYFNQFNSKNLFGFTDADKKMLKEQVLKPIGMGFGGMASMFVGMATIVAHPKLGMGLLAGGTAATNKAFSVPAKDRKYTGRYAFSKFGTPTMMSMQKEAVKRARKEMDGAVVENIKENHPGLYYGLKSDIEADAKKLGSPSDFVKGLRRVSVGTLGLTALGGIATFPMAAAGGITAGVFTGKAMGAFGNRMDKINQHAMKQAREQQEAFIQDGLNYQSAVVRAEIEEIVKNEVITEENDDKKKAQDPSEYEKELLKRLGYVYDEKTHQYVLESSGEAQTLADELEDKLKSKGYDSSTGTFDASKVGSNKTSNGVTSAEFSTDSITSKDKKVNKAKVDEALVVLNRKVEAAVFKIMIDQIEKGSSEKDIEKLVGEEAKGIQTELENLGFEINPKALKDAGSKTDQTEFVKNILRARLEFETAKIEIVEETMSGTSVSEGEIPVPDETGDLSEKDEEEPREKKKRKPESEEKPDKKKEQETSDPIKTHEKQDVLPEDDELREQTEAKDEDQSEEKDKSENPESQVKPNRNTRTEPTVFSTLSDTEKESIKLAVLKEKLAQCGSVKGKATIRQSNSGIEVSDVERILVTQESKKKQGESTILEQGEIKQETQMAVKEFLDKFVVTDTIAPKVENSSARATDMAKNRRKKKLTQLLELTDDSSTDESIEKIETLQAGRDKASKEQLFEMGLGDKKDSDTILEVLLKRKELEEINLYAKNELELKKGSQTYKNAIKEKSNAAVEHYKAKLEIEVGDYEYKEDVKDKSVTLSAFEQKMKTIESRKNLTENVRQENVSKNVAKFKDMRKKLESTEARMVKSEKEISRKGPITDIDSFFKDVLKEPVTPAKPIVSKEIHSSADVISQMTGNNAN